MIILGIDPGFRAAGYAILKKEGGRILLLDYGCLKQSSDTSVLERLGLFFSFFEEKISAWHVNAISLETPFLGKNAQNFLKLGYLRGALYLLAYKYKLTLQEFTPTQVKLSITGFGGAQKDQVAHVILKLFPKIDHKKTSQNDVTDALAVSLCGIWQPQKVILR